MYMSNISNRGVTKKIRKHNRKMIILHMLMGFEAVLTKDEHWTLELTKEGMSTGFRVELDRKDVRMIKAYYKKRVVV